MTFKFTDQDGTSLELSELNRINIIIGRNGAGKSRFLRSLDMHMTNNPDFHVNYVTPERNGSFKRDGNIESFITNDPNWFANVRRANQVNGSDFKAMSHLALRNAEIAYLRKLQNVDARGKSFLTDCLDPRSSTVKILSY